MCPKIRWPSLAGGRWSSRGGLRRKGRRPRWRKSERARPTAPCTENTWMGPLFRHGGKQIGMHQRLKLLVVAFEVHLQVGAVRIHGDAVERHFLRGRCRHLLV